MIKIHGKKGGASRRLLAVLAVGVLGQAAQPAQAAVAGAWETFSTQKNAAAWRVYDFADNLEHVPSWESGGDAHLYYTFTQDKSLGFFANSGVGSGAFTGDFSAQKISAVSCRVYIGNLSALQVIDCSLRATGPIGEDYYTNLGYYSTEFAGNGWWSVKFSLDVPWYYLDAHSQYLQVDPKTLTNIKEVNINFYPFIGSAGGSRVGIDDVKLEPTMPPALSTSVTATVPQQFRLAFTPAPGVKCRIEKLKTSPAIGWDTVIGQTDIKGPGEYVFLRPLAPPGEIFRVAAEAVYTMVVTP
jgi:hypothetical protein